MKISIIGHFARGISLNVGQTIKTRVLSETLKKKIKVKRYKEIDTFNHKKRKIILFILIILNLINTSELILVISKSSYFKILKYIKFFKRIVKYKIHYIVVGGDFAENLKDEEIKKFEFIDFIYVETNIMINELKKKGIMNTYKLVNFKIYKSQDLITNKIKNNVDKPYKICTFSRVDEMKGITETINLLNKINNRKTKYILDIYGRVEESFKEEFSRILRLNNDFINYKGNVNPEDALVILQNYDFLLFPTRYYTEGIPGTIVDALTSGLPIVTSNWKNSTELVKNGHTGYIYEFDNFDELKKILEKIYKNINIIISMKKNCIKESKKYQEDLAVRDLVNNIYQ